jgi:hypothetical protein
MLIFKRYRYSLTIFLEVLDENAENIPFVKGIFLVEFNFFLTVRK